MILIYSRSHIVHTAISYVCKEMDEPNIYCFSDRVKFLTTASLLDQAWIIMDTIASKKDDIVWLHGKLLNRVKEGDIYYLIKPQKLDDIYSIYLNTICSVQDLVEFIRMTQAKKVSAMPLSLAENLRRKINATLCATHLELIRHESIGPAGRCVYVHKYGNKAYLNRRHHLNKKLKLETLQEYYCMMFMLNDKNEPPAKR